MLQSREIATVPDIVRFWAARSPDSIALAGNSASTSYGALDRRSNQVANRMLRRRNQVRQSHRLPRDEQRGFL
jgi:non-ribosomal peptide synthetase component F